MGSNEVRNLIRIRNLQRAERRPYDYFAEIVSAGAYLAKSIMPKRKRAKSASNYGKKKKRRTSAVAGVTRTGGYYEGNFKEKRFFDKAFSFQADATAATQGSINLVPQGDGESGRQGRKMMIKSIQCRGYADYAPGTSLVGATFVSVSLVLDKQCNGVLAPYNLIYKAIDRAPTDLRNLANGKRFVLLKRWDMEFKSAAGIKAAFGNDVQRMDWFKNVNIPIEFDSTATDGSQATVRSNNLILMAGSTAEGDDAVNLEMNFRIRYWA